MYVSSVQEGEKTNNYIWYLYYHFQCNSHYRKTVVGSKTAANYLSNIFLFAILILFSISCKYDDVCRKTATTTDCSCFITTTITLTICNLLLHYTITFHIFCRISVTHNTNNSIYYWELSFSVCLLLLLLP